MMGYQQRSWHAKNARTRPIRDNAGVARFNKNLVALA